MGSWALIAPTYWRRWRPQAFPLPIVSQWLTMVNMGKINSKQKGNRGEREVAKLLRDYGYVKARRGQQFQGSPESPDVVGFPGFHVEVKHVERLNVYEALEQAFRDAGEDDTPIVFHRKNKVSWRVTMDAEDFLKLLDERMGI